MVQQEEHDHFGRHRQRPEQADRLRGNARCPPANDRECVVQSVAAQDERRYHNHEPELAKAQQLQDSGARHRFPLAFGFDRWHLDEKERNC